MTAEATVVAVYEAHSEVEKAVKALENSGLDVRSLSVVGKEYQTGVQLGAYCSTGDRVLRWGRPGAFWGAIWGLLFGPAFFIIPEVGPILVAGFLVAVIVAAREKAVPTRALSPLGAGLFSIGIPEDSVLKYESVVRADQFLVTSHGSPEVVRLAHEVLNQTPHAGLDLHAA